MVLFKLFHLLKKDALLTWRSKLWTLFELLLPLLLIIAPALLVKHLIDRVGNQLASISNQPSFQKDIYSPFIYVSGCGVGAAKVKNYMADSELSFYEKDILAFERVNRRKIIKKVRVAECGNHTDVAFSMERNLSSTLTIPLVGDTTEKSYMFLGYQYMMNKIFFGLMWRIMDHRNMYARAQSAAPAGSKLVLPKESLRNLTVPNFDNKLFTLPRPEFPPISSFVLLAFPFIYAVCMTLPVISVTRNMMVEKESIKPYLTTIGLPTWLFYVEHFLFGVMKSSLLVCSFSLVWVFMIRNFPFVVMLGIFVYTLNAISLAVLISTVFPSVKRVVEGMVLIWLGSLASSILYPGRGDAIHYLLSVNPNHAFGNFITAVTYRATAEGMTMEATFDSKVANIKPAGFYLIYMFVNAIWMLVLSIFMEKMFTLIGNFFVKTFWGGWAKLKTSVLKTKQKKTTTGIGTDETILKCQEASFDKKNNEKADIELHGLVKVFPNGERAVNGLTMKAMRGHVSVLLGHNGCGKSTTFQMITGVSKPTQGKVSIGGVDGRTKKARKCLGYCPQYNPLYEKLTVSEHLELINALKGGKWKGLQEEIDSLLEQIDLKDVLVGELSGGMRRKLCVCMAMIGGSRVILLDEPTAGMDPGARQDVQKMLTAVKKDRTILLTTHYMDEAEKLGDWVFVMSHGKMAASGSVHFLKRQYGEGLLLTLIFKNGSNLKESYKLSLEVCQSFIKSAKIKDERGQMMEISLAEDQKQKLPDLLKCLEAITEKSLWSAALLALPRDLQGRIQRLDIVTIGVSMSSLEQVFIRIGDECDEVVEQKKASLRKETHRAKFHALIAIKKKPAHKGILLALLVMIALLEKRVYYLFRNFTQILLQIGLPLAVLWYFAELFHVMKDDPSITNMIEVESLDLSQYPRSTVIVQQEDRNETRLLRYLETFENLHLIEEDFGKNVSELVTQYSAGLQKLGFIIQLDVDAVTSVHYNDDNPKNAAILMNLLATCMYLRFPATWHWTRDLPHISSQIFWVLTENRSANATFMDFLTWMILFATIIAGVVVQSAVFLSEERLCKFVHQQTLTGLSAATYWTMAFFWDLIVYSLVTAYMVGMVMWYEEFDGHIHEIVALLYLVLAFVAPVVYIVSTWVGSPTKSSFLLYMYLTIPYLLLCVAWQIMSGSKIDPDRKWTQMVFRIVQPTFGLIFGVLKIAAVTYGLTLTKVYQLTSIWEMDGLLIEMIVMGSAALLLVVCLLTKSTKCVKYCCWRIFSGRAKPRARIPYKDFEPCAAVDEEQKMIPKVDTREKVLVVQNLTKDYRKFRALNGLSVTVAHGECFGLLGENGAGKTTTFDVITGLTRPSGGSVLLDGKNIAKKKIRLGYCPQFDAMLPQLTGRQTLRIMARLQGYRNVKEVVESVLDCVGMKEHGGKQIKNCSGGQRRKLSVAVALISRAECIVLDEPTAGIDPRARRELWDILHAMREQSRCSIVLTSHSMEECEALCTRIGILRRGELIALGTSQAIKSQYGNTFVMTLVLNGLVDRPMVCEAVRKEMPEAILKTPETSRSTSLVWELAKRKDDKWSEKYAQVERLAKASAVKDYILTQASLEDTFIRLNNAN